MRASLGDGPNSSDCSSQRLSNDADGACCWRAASRAACLGKRKKPRSFSTANPTALATPDHVVRVTLGAEKVLLSARAERSVASGPDHGDWWIGDRSRRQRGNPVRRAHRRRPLARTRNIAPRSASGVDMPAESPFAQLQRPLPPSGERGLRSCSDDRRTMPPNRSPPFTLWEAYADFTAALTGNDWSLQPLVVGASPSGEGSAG